MKPLRLTFLLVLAGLVTASCDSMLDSTAYSELTREDVLESEEGINSVLNSAYANVQLNFDGHVFYMWGADIPTGMAWSRGGSIEIWFKAFENFTWNADHRYISGAWSNYYAAIRDANIVLSNIESETLGEDFIRIKAAEARFIRAYAYSQLYMIYGPIPLVVNPEDVILPRATDDEMRAFIEEELNQAAPNLPVANDAGRATRGSALAVLAKHYLNTKQWQKAVDATGQIMDLDAYGLVADYDDVFSLENEGNEEMIWVLPRSAPNTTNNFNSLIFPTDYPLPYPNNGVWAAETYYYDEFVDSFEPGDERRAAIATEYVSTESGEVVTLYGNDQSLPAKYPFDPNSSGPGNGNDIPVIRYADVLLTRAEALNEINGPTGEAIRLINQVRERSGASLLDVSDFTQESLREHILQERAWEFHAEGKSREDQLRHGVFISRAQARGINADEHHRLFPIPQQELDANPGMKQNPGY